MSNIPVWGTSIQPAEFALRRRCTSEGDLRVTSAGDQRVAFIPPSQILFGRITSEGDRRVTSEGDRRVVLQGLSGPEYFQTAEVTSDGLEPFGCRLTTAAWQPSGQGGECLFYWAFVTVSWSMAAILRVTPSVDGSDGTLVVPGGVIETVRSTFRLEQAAVGTQGLQRQSRVLAIPLVRRKVRSSTQRAFTRFQLRGQRLQLTIESTGPLGVGELMLDGIEVSFQPVRKADYPGDVDSTP